MESNDPLPPEVTPPGAAREGHEADWKAPGWQHPYVIYIALTVVLFLFLVLMGYLAIENGWIPNRNVNS